MKCLYEGCLCDRDVGNWCADHYDMIEDAKDRIAREPNKVLGRDKESYLDSKDMHQL